MSSRKKIKSAPTKGITDKLTPASDLEPDAVMRLSLDVPLRNRPELESLAAQLSNPAHPNYRKWITPEQFHERFGPATADADKLKAWAEGKGLKIVHQSKSSRVLLAEGKASQVEKAFNVKLKKYSRPDNHREFFAPDSEPTVEEDVPLGGVGGLDSFEPRSPSLSRNTQASQGVYPLSGSGPGGSYYGNDFYFTHIYPAREMGTGQYVATVQFDDYYLSDLQAYLYPGDTLDLTRVVVGGTTGPSQPNNIEVSLDIEMVYCMAPRAKQYAYLAPHSDPWGPVLQRVADDNICKSISISWKGGPLSGTEDDILLQMMAQGQTVLVASGNADAAFGLNGFVFPIDHPHVTAVGGALLKTNPGTPLQYASEEVWNYSYNQGIGSGGGVSQSYLIPDYQSGITSVPFASDFLRNVPDVAWTPQDVYTTYGNGLSQNNTKGTSCAAPLWAGLIALVNERAGADGPVGFINPTVYAIGADAAKYALCFNDITVGNNKSAYAYNYNPDAYYAQVGYDLCTGWGTPRAQLINYLIDINYVPPSSAQLNLNQLMSQARCFQSCVPRGMCVALRTYLLAKIVDDGGL